ncbi:MAG TPA: type II secretion system ATPase GspE [Candidatus Limnocylindria bacterium]|nr:type II secretion system ATPase GspE [Candidatus Limnocylindria bacterium]
MLGRGSMELTHRTLEQLLVEQGRISQDDLRKVKRLQQERGERLERLLLDLGFISEEDLLPLLSAYLGVETVHRRDFPTTPVPLGSLNLKFLKHAKVLPLAQTNGALTVAMSDPADYYTIQSLQLATGLQIEPRLARERDVLEGLETIYGGNAAGGAAAEPADAELEVFRDDEEDVDHLRDLASEAPVIRFVNLLISRAVEQRASDIHIEPFENELKVRYRIDGVLHDVEAPQRRLQAAIVSRIKIMAKLNIAERRLPQDGRIKLRLMGREIDLRVSTLPTLYGESVVLRILDRSSIVVNLESLGFPEDALDEFGKLITKPYGMILVTGPTGSGKTTTLYGALDKINSPDKKIITIEDPVEYQLFGVNQIHVKPQIGLTFANGLRSIVRQDPDVIMVGEIRDAETAEIAIQAALTGHLVFSTLHTNDAAGAVSRLLEMGVEDYLLASSLLGVLAQRLVRRVCEKCRQPAELTTEVLHEIGGESGEHVQVFDGQGCEECARTGYRGRSGIFELLQVTDAIRQLILKRSSADIIRDAAIRQGMRTLREDGLAKAAAGITTIEEVLRVTQEDYADLSL